MDLWLCHERVHSLIDMIQLQIAAKLSMLGRLLYSGLKNAVCLIRCIILCSWLIVLFQPRPLFSGGETVRISVWYDGIHKVKVHIFTVVPYVPYQYRYHDSLGLCMFR